MHVKFCGFRTQDDIETAVQLGVDAIGLVFYPPSPRAVTLDDAQTLVAAVPAFVSVVALVVNMTQNELTQLVSKVHFEAIRYAKNGYEIILIGHRGHAEVIGVVGEAEEKIHIVENPQEVENLPFSQEDKLAYITQTTLSLDDCKSIVDALIKRYPQIEAPKKSDICYATTNRQGAVKVVSKDSDVIVVVGSPNSSNSNRLREVAENNGTKAYMVNESTELKKEWFKDNDKVGITAGASTPETIVQDVISWLKSNFDVVSEVQAVTVEENEIFSLPKIS